MTHINNIPEKEIEQLLDHPEIILHTKSQKQLKDLIKNILKNTKLTMYEQLMLAGMLEMDDIDQNNISLLDCIVYRLYNKN